MTEPNETTISAWMSDNDAHTFATMLKQIEESGELISRAARTLMAGFDALDPDTGRTNREEMVREISDNYATLSELQNRLDLFTDDKRVQGKLRGFNRWHNLIDEELRHRVIQENDE